MINGVNEEILTCLILIVIGYFIAKIFSGCANSNGFRVGGRRRRRARVAAATRKAWRWAAAPAPALRSNTICPSNTWEEYNPEKVSGLNNNNTRVSCNNCVDPNTKKYCQKCEDGYVFEHIINSKGSPTWRCIEKEIVPIIPETLYYGTCVTSDYDACKEVSYSVCNSNIRDKNANGMYACNCESGYHRDDKKCIKDIYN